VGLGLSVVTACHLHRYLKVLRELFASDGGDLHLSAEVSEWLAALSQIFEEAGEPEAAMGPVRRRELVDRLGFAFEVYRTKVWEHGFQGSAAMNCEDALSFLDRCSAWVAATIRSNRREDGLYHTYNLVDFKADGHLGIDRLGLMLEGQVAALSSGVVQPEEAEAIGAALFESPLYRDDQRSFMLYPWRELPGFLGRNAVPPESVDAVPLLCELIEADETAILTIDADGAGRFHGDMANAEDVTAALDRLAEDSAWSDAVTRDRDDVLVLFEDTFHHRAFTGRSGTMYGYEGIGCIYWHMTSKLLLAIQENLVAAHRIESPQASTLRTLYELVREGLSASKTPAEYGAFPGDPYSHTSEGGRARQPGMTGQVKEEVITRFGELGVRVEDGCVHFDPTWLRPGDFTDGKLRFTFCGTPIEYVRDRTGVSLTSSDGAVTEIAGARLDRETSAALLSRTGKWQSVRVGLD